MKITRKQFISGGKGELSEPSLFDENEFEVGLLVEMEHTSDKLIATKIVSDHLTEIPNYYSKLISDDLVDEEPALIKAKELGWIK